VSDNETSWRASWTRLKRWQESAGLPVLPPSGALFELAAMVAVIVVIDWAFPQLGFMTLEPSPFWLPVLLLSLQYGTVAGLLAAAAATAAYVFNGVAEQAVGENFFSYLLRIWALPILWIGVALVLGQFRLRQIAAKQQLRQDLVKRTNEADRLAQYASDLEGRCQTLERHLTTRSASAVKPVLDALAAIADPRGGLLEALHVITQNVWPGSQASVSAVTVDGLVLIERSGWPETAAWSSDVASVHPLHQAVVVDRRAVSILVRGDDRVLAGLGVAAHPIVSDDGGRVIGMLKIEMIDPRFIDGDTAGHLALLARLLAPALAQPSETTAPARLADTVITRLARRWKAAPAAVALIGKVAAVERAPDDATQRTPIPRRSS
jgi:polysaccharide biosynthesis protein PelD